MRTRLCIADKTAVCRQLKDQNGANYVAKSGVFFSILRKSVRAKNKKACGRTRVTQQSKSSNDQTKKGHHKGKGKIKHTGKKKDTPT